MAVGRLPAQSGYWVRYPAKVAVVAALAFSGVSPTFGQPVAEISGPSQCQPGGWTRLAYVAEGGQPLWLIWPEDQRPNFVVGGTTLDGGSALIYLAGPSPGRVTVVLVVSDSEAAVAGAIHEIVVRGALPDPDPDPDPPGPSPDPSTATAVVVVYDEDRVMPSQVEIIAQLRKHFDATAIKFYALDREAVDEEGQRIAEPYLQAAGVPAPAVVIYSADQIKWRGALPATSREVIDHAK